MNDGDDSEYAYWDWPKGSLDWLKISVLVFVTLAAVFLCGLFGLLLLIAV